MRIITARDELVLATVRIISEGTVATGLLFRESVDDGPTAAFIVTNAHVVEGKRDAEIFFLQADASGDPILGQPYVFRSSNFADLWHRHPNPAIDIAVANFAAMEKDLDKKCVNVANRWLTPQHAFDDRPMDIPKNLAGWVHLFGVEVDAVEEVLFVGYPSGYFDRVNHLPIIRRGTTATSPFANYQNEPAFLVDAPILPGSSGSPVFIVDPSSGPSRSNRQNHRFLFLGVVTEFLPFKEVGKPPRPTSGEEDRLRLLTGLGLVYKPSAIREAIQSYFAIQSAGV